MRRRLLTALLPVFIIGTLTVTGQVAAQNPSASNGFFQRTWERTDTPVVTGNVSRTWMWGPAYTEEIWETYADSPDGRRAVQYFDKSRMEISLPHSDSSSIWYVTNGLLVVEMVTGEMQFGDTAFEELEPATVNVAGDGDDPNSPTYATFAELLGETTDLGTALVSNQIDRAGNISLYSGAATQNIHLGFFDDVTRHNIAAPFWEFMNAQGLVVEDGEFITSTLFQDPFFATGRPISEPYWATVRLAGVPVDVLIQCFERRCLTYTPVNAPEWRVEAGNVGLHYHIWRYGVAEHLLAWQRGTEIWAMNATGTALRSLTGTSNAVDSSPVWSPDGSQIAFVRSENGEDSVYLIDRDGSNLRKLTTGQSRSPYWSPDGSLIAYWSLGENGIFVKEVDGTLITQITSSSGIDTVAGWSTNGQQLLIERQLSADTDSGSEIAVGNVNGGEPVRLTPTDSTARMPSWSPDQSQIIFVSDSGSGAGNIWVMNSDGSGQQLLLSSSGAVSHPAWSPDGSMIAFVDSSSGDNNIWTMTSDGEDARTLTTTTSNDRQPTWSSNGSKIYFVSDRDGQNDLYVMDSDGSHVRRLTSDVASDENLVLSSTVDEPF